MDKSLTNVEMNACVDEKARVHTPNASRRNIRYTVHSSFYYRAAWNADAV